MNNRQDNSLRSSLAVRIGWGLLGCVLLVLAWHSTGDESAPRPADAAAPASSELPGLPGYVHKNIEDVEVGDWVLARNEETGEFASRPVVEVYRRRSDHLRVLNVQSLADGSLQQIETTDEHPFWVSGRGWVEAGDLAADDKLSDASGRAAVVLASRYEPHPDGVAVYNFQVASDHSYYVRSGQTRGPPLWVHNGDYGNGAKRLGTLSRNDVRLAANLGGRLDDHTPHHLLGVAEVDKYPVMHRAADLGYDVNRGSNGINLPNNPVLAKELNLPYHPKRGRHSLATYTGPVNERLHQLQQRYDNGLVTDSNLLTEIRKIEDSVRADLLDRTLKLNSRY